jgi:anthranilate phosphoribosyltransferase
MSLRAAIDAAIEGREVPAPLLESAFGEIMDGRASATQSAALLVALRTKGETVGEIVAAARAVRARAHTTSCPDPRAVDTCGTGGDAADTFNISTAAAFVVAGAGVPVAKHGNRAASSRAGSIDVLEALGVNVELPVEAAAKVLVEIGITVFFARVAHPAMRALAPVREALGVRTLMNCLGPLLNPVGVRFQLVGVYSAALVEKLAAALGQLGSTRALVVHGDDGLDEITTTSHTDAAWLEAGRVRRLRIDPRSLGIELAHPDDLGGGDALDNAAIVRAVLAGQPGPRRDIVLLNAAGALWVAGAVDDLAAGLVRARRSLDDGAAARKLAQLVAASRSAA